MKQKIFLGVLAAEALLCVLLHSMKGMAVEVFSGLMAFPFEALGYSLRQLSLSGSMGNVAAIVIYVGCSLIPVYFLLWICLKKKFYPEDALLAVLSILLLVVMYLMINPGLIQKFFGIAVGSSTEFGKAFLGGMVYSVLTGYVVLKVLRLFFGAESQRLQSYLRVLLGALNMLLVYMIFGGCYGSFLESVEQVKETNTGTEAGLGMTYFFLFLQLLINALPYVLDIFIVLALQKLLDQLVLGAYTEESVNAADKLSKACGFSLMITTLSSVGFNLLQLLMSKDLRVINGTVQVPLLSIVLVLAALLAAQLVKEGKKLKDDNDMFI